MHHKQTDTCTQNHRERYSAAIMSAGWNTGSNGGEKMSREGGETLASITINYPTPHRKGDSLRNRKHCGGQASFTVPSTITPMHARTRSHTHWQLHTSIHRLSLWAISFHLILWHGNDLHFVILNCNCPEWPGTLSVREVGRLRRADSTAEEGRQQ